MAAAGAARGWCWWRAQTTRLVLAPAAGRSGRGGASRSPSAGSAADRPKAPGLHVIYGLLPLLVSFVAEQLRVASAQMILDSRGFESADEVGELPEDEQRGVVLAIVQREIGVMALAALVVVVLLARAAGTA